MARMKLSVFSRSTPSSLPPSEIGAQALQYHPTEGYIPLREMLLGFAAEQGVNQGVFGTMRSRFDGQAGAFAYLLFVLLYFPCVATIGAIKREAGTPWAAFVAGWTTLVAYITAASFYQVARFDLHPAASSAWLMGMWSVFALVVLLLRRWERRRPEPASKPVRVEA